MRISFNLAAGPRLRLGAHSALVLWAVLAWHVCVSAIHAADSRPSRLVVVLYPEANDGSPGSILADRGIRTTFSRFSSERIEIHNEYLDVSRFPDGPFQQDLAAFLKRKYAGRKVDLVIAGLASALDFALNYRDEVFPKVPIVCLAVDRQEIEARKLPADVIGSPISMDLGGSLDLALQIHPETKRVFVVVGKSKFDAFWEAKARSAFQPHGNRIEIEYLVGLPLSELLPAVEQLPEGSLIYYVHEFEDRDGRVHMPAEVLDQLAARANVPIYSHVDSYVGRGIVGGRVFSFEAAGKEAAQLGLRVLTGEDPVRIGIQPTSHSSYIFDGRQLERWHIPTASLPAGSEVRHREPTLWQRYRWQVAGVAGLVGIQALLIAGLLVQRKRRARAESELHENREELRQLAGQILVAQETERRRIARELHDDFGQELALLSVELDLYSRRPAPTPADAGARIDAMSARVKHLSSTIHDLSHELHPMKLEQLGLVAAIRGLCKELNENQDLTVEFHHESVPVLIPPDVALCLFRIAQESLRNVVKHSCATSAAVELAGNSDSIRLEICDAGSGFDPAEVTGKGGLGLVSMQERLRLVRGALEIQSERGGGTRVTAHVPLCAGP